MGNRRYARETDAQPNEAAERMKDQARIACAAIWDVIGQRMIASLASPVIVYWKERRELRPPEVFQMKDFLAPNARPRLAVLSCLAAGADQIGARTALDLGQRDGRIDVHLEAVLPFEEKDYPGHPDPRPEFRQEEAAELRDLAARASQVVRLGGRYGPATEPERDKPENSIPRVRAYRQGRDVLLQNADILVAVYDPHAAGLAAGSVETVVTALSLGLPVLAVLVSEHEARIALYRTLADRPGLGADAWKSANHVTSEGWKKALRELVSYQIFLPHMIGPEQDPAQETDEGRRKREQELGTTVSRLRILFGDAPAHRTCRGGTAKTFFTGVWNALLDLGRSFEKEPHPLCSVRKTEPDHRVTIAPFAGWYDRSSKLSGNYMARYRGAFVLAFVLAALAAVFAVGLLTAAIFWHGEHLPLGLLLPLGGAKIAILLTLLWFEHTGRHARHQEHAADFRYFSELLRPMQWLAPLGTGVPAVELPPHYAPLDPRQGWAVWLFRAVSRSTPCVARAAHAGATASNEACCPREVSFTPEIAATALREARTQWVEDQVHYHAGTTCKMHAIDEGLEHLAKILLGIVLGCAIVGVGLEIALVMELVHGDALHAVAIVLGALAAALPACIAALGGIMVQSEAKRLRIRHESMYQGLKNRQRALDTERLALERSQQGGETWEAAQRLRALAGDMLGETVDWKALYQLHEVKAG